MKNLILTCLAVLTIAPLQAEPIDIQSVPEQDSEFLQYRIRTLEGKAHIHSHQWKLETENDGKKKFLVFEELMPDGSYREWPPRLEAFAWEPHTWDRITITSDDNGTISSCPLAAECTEYPATRIDIRTNAYSTGRTIFRVISTEYKQGKSTEDGVLCIMKSDHDETYRLRLVVEEEFASE